MGCGDCDPDRGDAWQRILTSCTWARPQWGHVDIRSSGSDRAARRGPVLPGRRFPHRSVAAGATCGDHPRPWRSRAHWHGRLSLHRRQYQLQLLHTHSIATLWILGDLAHGPALPAAWQRRWAAWCGQHAQLAIHAIHGNHDRVLRRAGLELELAGESVELGPFLLRHEPQPHPDLHVLCGHLHPLARLPGINRRWPAFWMRAGITVLPAHSEFSAGVVPRLASGERLIACVEGAAIALPVR